MHARVRRQRPQPGRPGDPRPGRRQRLLDRDFYAPTIYFRWWCRGDHGRAHRDRSKATLDAFAEAIRDIVRQAKEEPEQLHTAPHNLPVGRLDEVATARRVNAYLQGQSEDPILRWKAGLK